MKKIILAIIILLLGSVHLKAQDNLPDSLKINPAVSIKPLSGGDDWELDDEEPEVPGDGLEDWIERYDLKSEKTKIFGDEKTKIYISSSQEGVKYQLTRSKTVLETIYGTGEQIHFTNDYGIGTYSVLATADEARDAYLDNLVVEYHTLWKAPDRFFMDGTYEMEDDGGTANGFTLQIPIHFYGDGEIPGLRDAVNYYNAGLVSYWNNSIQIEYDFSQQGEEGSITTQYLIFRAGPNFSDKSITNFTKFPVANGDEIIIRQSPGGQFTVFNVTGTTLNKERLCKVSLSGSQPLVTYHLMKDDKTVGIIEGTGQPLEFFATSSPGIYTVKAVYQEYEQLMNGQYEATTFASNNNYVLKRSYTEANGDRYKVLINYMDALGRQTQSIAHNEAPNGGNIVSFSIYDETGRADKIKYLPYVSYENNLYRINDPLTEQKSWYRNQFPNDHDTNWTFAENQFDESPLNRLLRQSSPGYNSSMSQHPVAYEYGVNTASDLIKKYSIDPDGRLYRDGYYPDETLNYVATSVENLPSDISKKTYEYSNGIGQLVAKRTLFADAEPRTTYYVYDQYGLLRYEIAPNKFTDDNGSGEGSGDGSENEGPAMISPMSSGLNGFSSTMRWFRGMTLSKFVSYYEYDHYGNLTAQSVPGMEPALYIYDKRGRLVMSQSGNQRELNQWSFSKYDIYNRAVISGTISGGTYEQHRQAVQDQTSYGENLLANSSYFYTRNTYPYSYRQEDVYNITFYDNYDWVKSYYKVRDESAWDDGGGDSEEAAMRFFALDDNQRERIDCFGTVQALFKMSGSGENASTGEANGGDGDGTEDNGSTGEDGETDGEETDGDGDTTSPGEEGGGSGGDEGCIKRDKFDYFYEPNFTSLPSTRINGLITGNITKVLSGKSYEYQSSVIYYDDDHNTIQTISDLYPKGVEVVWNEHNFVGAVTQTKVVQSIGDTEYGYFKTFDYDGDGRLMSVRQRMIDDADNGEVTLVQYEYQRMGEVLRKSLHNGLETIENDYRMTGKLNGQYSSTFSFQLGFDRQIADGLPTRPDGLISSVAWGEDRNLGHSYQFTYDHRGQLISALSGQRTGSSFALSGRYDERDMAYDWYGNITGVQRTDGSGESLHQIGMEYSTSDVYRLEYVTVDGVRSEKYIYDANGNMTYDPTTGVHIEYNNLNLPVRIFDDTGEIRYIYDASGQKLATVDNGSLTYYRSVMTYVVENGGPQRITRISTDGGFIAAEGTGWTYKYMITDYLGHVRSVVAARRDADGWFAECEQRTDFYPYGLAHELGNLHVNRYLFGGKELQDHTIGKGSMLGFYDFHARYYNPMLGRWFNVDPAMQLLNPYLYCKNNPVMFIDPDGEFIHLIIGAFVGGIVNMVTGKDKWDMGRFAVGFVTGALGAAIGGGISSSLAVIGETAGSFSAGMIGTKAALSSTGFVAGAAAGAGSGFVSGFTTGIGNALLDGKNFGQALGKGGLNGLMGGASGALIGGMTGGIRAKIQGKTFWNGDNVSKGVLADRKLPFVSQEGTHDCAGATAESLTRGELSQQQVREAVRPGSNPNADGLEDLSVMEKFQRNTGRNITGIDGTKVDLNDLPGHLANDGDIALSIKDGDNIGHSVAINRVKGKIVTHRITGNVLRSKLIFEVMDPAVGQYVPIDHGSIYNSNVWMIDKAIGNNGIKR